MSTIRISRALAAAVILSGICLLATTATLHAQSAPAALDATLFTTYTISSGDQNVNLVVCGSTAESEGCYGSGSMGPFGKAGALIEGTPMTNGSTVTR
jgi:hypothetical protein